MIGLQCSWYWETLNHSRCASGWFYWHQPSWMLSVYRSPARRRRDYRPPVRPPPNPSAIHNSHIIPSHAHAISLLTQPLGLNNDSLLIAVYSSFSPDSYSCNATFSGIPHGVKSIAVRLQQPVFLPSDSQPSFYRVALPRRKRWRVPPGTDSTESRELALF